jgi:hypothetical protein
MSTDLHRPDTAGDTWLTPRDAELLHILTDTLPVPARRELALTLQRAGQLPPMTADPDPAE